MPWSRLDSCSFIGPQTSSISLRETSPCLERFRWSCSVLISSCLIGSEHSRHTREGGPLIVSSLLVDYQLTSLPGRVALRAHLARSFVSKRVERIRKSRRQTRRPRRSAGQSNTL